MTLANASALLSLRVATDLDATLGVLKTAVGKHPGVNLEIVTAIGPTSLDHDLEGFDTVVVSYFTVPLRFSILVTVRMFLICMATLNDTYTGLEGMIAVLGIGADPNFSILTAHGPNESVEKADLLEAVEGYKKLIMNALQ